MMRPRILVVDDDPAERESMAELLRLWGYQTDMARDGFDALEKVLSFVPDLVVSDLHMPLMDGIQLLQILKRQSRVMSSIIIAGELTPSEKCQGVALGAFALLEKPVDPERLRTELANCLRAQQIRPPFAPGEAAVATPSRRRYATDGKNFWSKAKTG